MHIMHGDNIIVVTLRAQCLLALLVHAVNSDKSRTISVICLLQLIPLTQQPSSAFKIKEK